MTLRPRAVVVHRRTEYEALLDRHGTPQQAEFFLRTRGQEVDEVLARHELVRAAIATATAGIPTQWRRAEVERADLARFVFGPEDDFVNKFASMARWLPLLPVIRGDWRLQPVFAADLGRAIAAAALDPVAHAGKTYELAGPNVTTMRELNRWVARAAGHPRGQFDIPDPIAKAMARVGGFLPGAPMTWDQWLMLQSDNVADPALPGLAALGIRPTPLEAVAEEWLVAFKRNGRFAKAPSA